MVDIRRSLFVSKLITWWIWRFKPLFMSSSLKILKFCRRVFVFPSQFALHCSVFLPPVHFTWLITIISLAIICHSISVFLENVWKRWRKLVKNWSHKLVWQVFISDQLATALMKVCENSTHVSLSHILIISRPGKRVHLLSSILYSLSWIINLLLDGPASV